MFIVTPDTVWNPAALETRSVPKRMLGRISVLPRHGGTVSLWARLVFEVQVLRFSTALAPFVVAMLLWPRFALPIAQAPLAMILVVGVVEMWVLAVPKDKRAGLIGADAAAAGLDALRFRAMALLTRIAAQNAMAEGELTLVVEQSGIARVTPLTLVSVQRGGADPAVLALTQAQRKMIRDTLFDATLTERLLQTINQRDHEFIRTATLDARSISAHARMAALTRPAA